MSKSSPTSSWMARPRGAQAGIVKMAQWMKMPSWGRAYHSGQGRSVILWGFRGKVQRMGHAPGEGREDGVRQAGFAEGAGGPLVTRVERAVATLGGEQEFAGHVRVDLDILAVGVAL